MGIRLEKDPGVGLPPRISPLGKTTTKTTTSADRKTMGVPAETVPAGGAGRRTGNHRPVPEQRYTGLTLVGVTDSLIIPRRFNGPPDSGNGGYVSGRLAVRLGELLDAAEGVTVVLRNPTPLETPLQVTVSAGRLRLHEGERLLAEAMPGKVEAAPIPPVPYETAAEATARYPGKEGDTPFARCFVCGPAREDGLGLAPGPVDDRTVATPWTPDAALEMGPEIVSAALDCPGGWSTDLLTRPALLGTMTVRVTAVPEAGERCVVLGRRLRRAGRKTFTTSTAYGEDGRLLGRADQIWIELAPR